jgi:hypothetical protein
MSDLQIALRVALRALDNPNTTDAETDAVLSAIIAHSDDRQEAETAARALHHRREARAHQMQLTQLFTARRAA